MTDHYECIVIGGGPAGSTTATLLARQGRRVLLLERSKFPRHHIGESLMPNTYFVFEKLGMLEKMKRSDFVRKESVQFVSANGKDSAPFFFPDRDPGEWSSTWQVTRATFDQMMLDHAREQGVEAFEQANVKEVLFEGDRAVGVRAAIAGEVQDIFAQVIVDATGQSGLLSRQLQLRYGDDRLKNAVLYSYWKNAQRDPGRNAGATLVIALPGGEGWFWFIPLEDDITSIGVVAPPHYLYNGRGDDPGAILDEEIANTPGLARRMGTATRVRPIYTTADYSYRSRRAAGDGWVLVGELAAGVIHEALAAGDVSEARLGHFGPVVAEGMQRIRMLVYAYYDPTFRMGAFVRQYPHLKDPITRVLIGDVFEDDLADLFATLGRHLKLPEAIRVEGKAPVS